MHAQAKTSGKVAAIFDLDHTITDCDTYAKFLRFVAMRRPGRWPTFLPLPFKILMAKSGLRDNHWLKEQALTAVAGGLSAEKLSAHSNALVDLILTRHLRPGAREALAAHARQGHRMILASASFEFYLNRLARELGFREVVCTQAEFGEAGHLLGKIRGRNCYGQEKLRQLEVLFGKSRDDWYIVAYSDHYTDLPVLEWADEGRAVHPDRRLSSAAQERGLAILDWG